MSILKDLWNEIILKRAAVAAVALGLLALLFKSV